MFSPASAPMITRVAGSVCANHAQRTKTKSVSSCATNAKAFGVILVTKPQRYIFVMGKVAPQSAVKTAETSSFAVVAMKSAAEIA